MRLNKAFSVILCALVLCLMLVACSLREKEDGTVAETESGAAQKVENESDGGEEKTTDGKTEEKETAPRFDYFSVEDFSEYVKLDRSVYENMTISLEDKYTVGEEHIDECIDGILFQKKTVKNNGAKVTGEAIALGDTAYIFYRGVMLDEATGEYKEFEGGSNMSDASPYALSIGSGSFIDGFEDGLIGVVPAETSPENMVSLNLTFPDNYGSTELAGKDVIFYVYVSWTVQYEIPEYNETFIKDVLKYTPTTDDVVAEHREFIRKSLEESLESSKGEAIEAAIWEELYNKAEILKYPEGEVEYFYNAYCADLEEAMIYYNYYGYGFTDINVFAKWYLGLDESGDWQSVIREQSKKAVSQALIYHAIAEACGLEVTEEEFKTVVKTYIDLYRQQYNKEYTEEEVIELIGKSALMEGTLYEKVISHIKDGATVTYK